MSGADELSVEALAQRCAAETVRYAQKLLADPQFCLELLRRALRDELAEALTHVYRIYERQVLRWVSSHSAFPATEESADYFARTALSNFYFALRGERFQDFSSLEGVLKYLKRCVHTAIAQYLRDQRPGHTVPLAAGEAVAIEGKLESRHAAGELWAEICRVLPDPQDQLLARYVFVLDLKPRQIVALPAQLWQSEREVSVRLYRIRQRLRQDTALRRLAEQPELDLPTDGAA